MVVSPKVLPSFPPLVSFVFLNGCEADVRDGPPKARDNIFIVISLECISTHRAFDLLESAAVEAMPP